MLMKKALHTVTAGMARKMQPLPPRAAWLLPTVCPFRRRSIVTVVNQPQVFL